MFWKRLLWGRHGASTELQEKRVSIDAETDSLRYLLEAYLADYNSVRRELEHRIELQHRITDYLLVLLGSVLSASQLLGGSSSQFSSWLSRHPFALLLLATVSLWFPITSMVHFAWVSTLSSYLATVLSPKIAHLATSLAGLSTSTGEQLEWEERRYPADLRGPFTWDAFWRKCSPKAKVASSFGGLHRFVLLHLPAFLFVSAFLTVGSDERIWVDWTALERVFGAAFLLVFAANLLIAVLALTNYRD